MHRKLHYGSSLAMGDRTDNNIKIASALQFYRNTDGLSAGKKGANIA